MTRIGLIRYIIVPAHWFFNLWLGVVIPSAARANRSVAKACTAPAKMFSNALHSVGMERYKTGAMKAETAPALMKRWIPVRAILSGRSSRFHIESAMVDRLRSAILQLWIRNQKSASLGVPGLWLEYCHQSAVVGIAIPIVTKNGRPHQDIDCACSLIPLSWCF